MTTSPSFFQKSLKRASQTIQDQSLETRSMVQLQTLRINPLSIVSAALFLISPFLSWITVSAFGLTVQSTLPDITRSNVPLDIPQDLPVASAITTILLIIGGLALLRTAKIGLPIAAVGLVVYLSTSYSLYRTPVSVIPITIAPGLGLVTAIVSEGIAAASLRVQPRPVRTYLLKITSRRGITTIGVFTATTALTIDGLNHIGQGEFSSFIGTGAIEPVFHLGFLVSILLISIFFLARRSWTSPTTNSITIAAAFAFILLDAAYHISTGEVSGFLSHDPTETMLHVFAYYGTAFMLVGRLAKK